MLSWGFELSRIIYQCIEYYNLVAIKLSWMGLVGLLKSYITKIRPFNRGRKVPAEKSGSLNKIFEGLVIDACWLKVAKQRS